MDFNAAKKQAFVDDEPVSMNAGMTAQQLLQQQGHSPSNKTLTQIKGDGKTQVLKPNDRINPENGQFVTTVTPTGGRK